MVAGLRRIISEDRASKFSRKVLRLRQLVLHLRDTAMINRATLSSHLLVTEALAHLSHSVAARV